ncbi:hypothetical protein M3661_29155 [Paenibacillus sp. MER 180]|uniref:hypothetical protein n=1 Tax=unclassified Paenibacillus TaxID=185978 RepID=UPI0008066B62|nr:MULTISPECIES: hypothetical protein [unclassified Paenibacillus]MCM3294169.1 hypothetical protein [Paenibacillus sp. MER 180]OBY76783.1 hypothetical protein BBG47_25220 [Paenibacillus sp. KS1]
MKVWGKHPDPNNKYGATFTLGESDTDLPENAIISVTRGEKFDFIRIIINGIVNEFVKKQLTKNENLIYAKLSGQLQGGIGQTVTIWRDRESMNRFRAKGAHKFAKRFFSWVFYGGKVEAYFLTWRIREIPTEIEIEKTIKEYGRYFVGGKLVRQSKQPNSTLEVESVGRNR